MKTGATLTTLADQWQHAAMKLLPNDAAFATMTRTKRDWYAEQLERLAAIPNRTPQEQALFAEALGFGRAIGTAAELATA